MTKKINNVLISKKLFQGKKQESKEKVVTILSEDLSKRIPDEKEIRVTDADLKESISDGVKKRLPWLLVLLALGMVVSSVVGAFEKIVAQLEAIAQ